MIILIRADATLEIGSGHVMRCAALGMRLMTRGALVHFVCVDLPERLADWLRERGFGLTVLSATDIADWRADLAATCEVVRQVGHADLLIVDHYGLERRWESGMRPYTRCILVIDDLADRDHDCDLLLDQNLHEDAEGRYMQRVPRGARQFLGPQYALLRAEFDEHGLDRARDGSVKRLLVFFGGTDSGNQSIKVIDALRALGSCAPESTIVLGPANPYRDAIHKSADNLPNVHVRDATDQISMLMAQADLAIGTCGVAAWERCALGLPCLVVVTSENQREDAEILHRLGAVEHLGDADEVSAANWESALRRAMDDPHRIRSMALAAKEVMAGRRTALAELERALFDGML
jgi:UDP-2,4-diacetamido-2,4,6-trideoxy-beta-L-altropyranose hydrolase